MFSTPCLLYQKRDIKSARDSGSNWFGGWQFADRLQCWAGAIELERVH